jgi:type I restriction enzyme M protein
VLDTDTKRRIDTARDILVGKVPDPKSQVEQITIALIYKFMDDMDAITELADGERSFFTGEFARYGWAKLMGAGIGGHELIALYGEGISTMPQNPGIPVLFRDIFKNAYLPYRDPETLKSFLKIINEFSYDHSERLGDAFEYLLSVLGSQGDAGQFRTPRHIIDFMVEILAPQKGEIILDPACGTAGFLISAYKHILRTNSSPRPQAGAGGEAGRISAPFALSLSKGKNGMQASTGSARTGRVGDLLTPEEKGQLAQNFKGYDISPDMVRLSLVNLYLHGFTDPHIVEYDTLTSEERWNEYADVILANPPFMSPKGGIKPHKRFSIQAKRSEVLFVDYMAEHLTPTGRAGIIVPEGIIFQSQTAYKELRKMLVENSLVAVVSLPAGCFNPYSGVKTSILILDKSIAKQSNSIAFFKVENDGYGLGAQRRANAGEQLTQVQAELAEYLQALRSHQPTDSLQPTLGLIVAKEKIATNGDYNLSGEKYREGIAVSSSFPLVLLGDVCDVSKGSPITRDQVVEGSIPVIAGGQKPSCFHNASNRTGETITVSASGAYAGFVAYFEEPIFASDCSTIKPSDQRLLTKFLFHLLKTKQSDIYALQVGMGQPHVYSKDLAKLQIPLPPLEVQHEIVAEIEGYQKVIDGARAVLDNYRPHIPIHPGWPVAALGEVSEVTSSKRILAEEYVPSGTPFYRTKEIVELSNGKEISLELFISQERFDSIKARFGAPAQGDLLVSAVGTIGVSWVVSDDREFYFKDGNLLWLRNLVNADPYFLKYCLDSTFAGGIDHIVFGAAYKALTIEKLKEFKIPLPDIATQQAIVAEIEAEQALVAANRELVARFEKKIQATLARIWGEEEPAAPQP